MQSGGVQKGVSSQSLLFHSLKVYLNNKDRLQPLIGLSCVTECVNVGCHGEALYLCDVCISRLSKADIRSHIMGSLHRYNYIKAWHPHFVSEWKESADLSKLAWPLMEIAQILEKREGTGDVQVLQCDAATYREMASSNKVKTLLCALKSGQEPKVTQTQAEKHMTQPLECPAAQPQRVVLPPRNLNAPQKATKVQMMKTIQSEIHKPLISVKRPAVSSQSSSVLSPQKSKKINNKTSVELGNHSYKGSKPMIGLGCVVECRNNEDGSLTCFLCHCCRSKATKDDITDHLTSASHHFNYMMEFHPDRVEVMRGGLRGNRQILSSAARKVEQEEGRGQLQVMRVAASLYSQLSVNSYHWCTKNLPGTKIQNREKPVPCDSRKQTVSVLPLPCDHVTNAGCSKQRGGMGKKKMKSAGGNPVFKVSLPLIEGQLLMERTTFSSDDMAEFPTHSPAEDSALLPQATGSSIPPAVGIHKVRLGPAPPQHLICMGKVESPAVLQHTGENGGFNDSGSQEEEDYFTFVDDKIRRVFSTSQPLHTTGLGDRVSVYVSAARRGTYEPGERASNVPFSTLETIRDGGAFHTNEGMFEDEEEQTCHMLQNENGQTYYMHEEGFCEEERLYKSELQGMEVLTVEVPRGKPQERTHLPYRPSNQYNPYDLSGPHRYDSNKNDMDPHWEHHRGWSHGATQPYPDLPQTPPNTYVTQPNIHPSYPGCRVIFNPQHNDGFRTSPDLHTLHPDNNSDGLKPSTFIVPEQAEAFVSHPDFYPRETVYGQLSVISGFGYGPSYQSSQSILSPSLPLSQAPYWGPSPSPYPGHTATQFMNSFF